MSLCMPSSSSMILMKLTHGDNEWPMCVEGCYHKLARVNIIIVVVIIIMRLEGLGSKMRQSGGLTSDLPDTPFIMIPT